MRTIIGIDIGGSTTKIVGFHRNNKELTLIEPQFVRAADPITSIYGAFGRFTSQNDLELGDIDRVMMTGVGSSFVTKPLYALDCRPISEFSSVGLGGLYLSGLDEALVVSMGTGTAMIRAKRISETNATTDYLGGTGVGGGTLIGLSRKILGVDNIDHIEQLCEGGDLNKIDLRIKDMANNATLSGMNPDLTASNFGKLSDIANKHDIALGIANMVAETVSMTAIFAARSFNIKNIVLTGNLVSFKPIRETIEALGPGFGVNFIIPQYAQFGTAIGAALNGV